MPVDGAVGVDAGAGVDGVDGVGADVAAGVDETGGGELEVAAPRESVR